MTKDQEVIERLTNGEKIDFNTLIRKFKKEGIENFVVTKKEYIETVLNILKQNSAELAEKSAEIEKDKIIDLMAEHINYLSDELVQATGRNELEFCNGNKCCIDSDYSCEQCIKQYFKQKATNNGQERQNVVERKGEEC